jgi:predicted DNA binding CopG/RHH family protein
MRLKGKGRNGTDIEIETPNFKTEAEEAAWWDAHSELITDLLIKHGKPPAAKTKPVTIRLPEQDIARAKRIAKQQGIKYQPLLKSLLHEALQRYGQSR